MFALSKVVELFEESNSLLPNYYRILLCINLSTIGGLKLVFIFIFLISVLDYELFDVEIMITIVGKLVKARILV